MRPRSVRGTAAPGVDALREVAVGAARAGGRRTLEGFGRRVPAETKADGSPVTRFDRASESEIRRFIGRRYPEHTVVGEELGTSGSDPTVRWIIDPIDGTKSFVHGVPLYAVLIGVEVRGRPTVGVIHMPALGETIDAATGRGCRWNGRKAVVSDVRRLADATILTTSVRSLESRGIPFHRISAATRVQRGWGDGYGYGLVATGRADAMVDAQVSLWDTAPMLPILAEAGGRFTDWAGRVTIRSQDAVGTNGRVHAELVRLLRG